MRFIAYITKGLEDIAENELYRIIEDIEIVEKGIKYIIFDTQSNFEKLVRLKTIDDIGIFISFVNLKDLVKEIEAIDFSLFQKQLLQFREFEKDIFSLTISRLENNVNTNLIKSRIVEILQKKYDWKYMENVHSNFDIRINIVKNQVYLSVRLTRISLYMRPYKVYNSIGSLKPTIAAAMVQLATNNNKSGLKIIDDFCGSGTILCESILAGNDIYGGDIDSKCIMGTTNNLQNLSYKIEGHIRQLNAINTHWDNNYFDCAISNLPWDKQIEVESITNLYAGTLREYARIIKKDGVVCLLVSKPDLLIKYVKKYFPNHIINSYKIGLLGQTPTIVFIQ